MPDAPHPCSCCNPFVGDAVRAARAMSSAHRMDSDGDARLGLDRRTLIKGGVALAAAAATVSLSGSAEAEESATTVFRGGTILKVDKAFGRAEAIAFRGERILAVGTEAEVRRAAGETATVVDLKGRTMLPGFIEPHTHMLSGSILATLCEYVGVAKFDRYEQVASHLKELAAKRKPGEWIVARNFDPSLQEGPEALTFAELDAVSTKHPVFVINASGHLAYANRRAFEVAGIDESVKNPPGAEFVRNAEGKLTGTMKNNVAFVQVLQHYPGLSQVDPLKALVDMTATFARKGMTTLSDLGMGALHGAEDWALYRKAAAGGALSARLRLFPFYTAEKAWDESGIKPGDGDAMVRIVGYKVVADGSNQGFTGLQREPYLGTDNHGIAYTAPDELLRLVRKQGGAGWPLAIHGNGDKAIDNILDAFAKAKASGLDVASLRPRIEHCSILHDDQIARMKTLGVSASFLIGHVHYWGVAFRDRIFGKEKAMLLDRARSCEKAGVGFTLHSDFFVTDPDPLHMIEMAVTRRTWKEPDYALAPEEAISVESAIRALTSTAAWQLGSEHEVGSLEAGKFADAVILAENPCSVAPTTIKGIEVLETWLGGKRVHGN